jgi:predicted metal-dependent hydrolase
MTTSAATTLVDGRPLRYTVRRSRRARRPGIEVSRRTGVVLVLPRRAAASLVPELLRYWAGWMARKADEFGVWDGPFRRQYATGSELPILGRPRRLVLTALPADRSRMRAELRDDELELTVPPAVILDPRPALEKYLRDLAGGDLRRRAENWTEAVGRAPRRIIVGERTSRWGSCSRRGTLSFCYRLVLAPPAVIDAVVAHEACHLVHLNHGRGFYRLLDRVYPDHRRQMDWLHRHEDDLLL